MSNGLNGSQLMKNFTSKIVYVNNSSTEKPIKRDSIMISNEARAQLGDWQEKYVSMVESLMEKRQQIQEMKSNLIENTLEAGEELSTIKAQLAELDEQIAEIEGQMLAIETQKREREQREKEEKQQAAAKTADNAESLQLAALLQSAQSLDQVSALKQVKVPIENAHRRLKTEMQNDIGRGTFLESKAKKIEELAGRMRNLDSAMNDQIRKARESSNEVVGKVSDAEEQEELASESFES